MPADAFMIAPLFAKFAPRRIGRRCIWGSSRASKASRPCSRGVGVPGHRGARVRRYASGSIAPFQAAGPYDSRSCRGQPPRPLRARRGCAMDAVFGGDRPSTGPLPRRARAYGYCPALWGDPVRGCSCPSGSPAFERDAMAAPQRFGRSRNPPARTTVIHLGAVDAAQALARG